MCVKVFSPPLLGGNSRQVGKTVQRKRRNEMYATAGRRMKEGMKIYEKVLIKCVLLPLNLCKARSAFVPIQIHAILASVPR